MLQTKTTLNYTVHYNDTDVSDRQLNLIIARASWKFSKLTSIVDITWDFLNDNFIISLFDEDYNFIEQLSEPVSDFILYDTGDEILF